MGWQRHITTVRKTTATAVRPCIDLDRMCFGEYIFELVHKSSQSTIKPWLGRPTQGAVTKDMCVSAEQVYLACKLDLLLPLIDNPMRGALLVLPCSVVKWIINKDIQPQRIFASRTTQTQDTLRQVMTVPL